VGAALAAGDISYSMFQTIDVNNSLHKMSAIALCPSNPRKGHDGTVGLPIPMSSSAYFEGSTPGPNRRGRRMAPTKM
jgi:hypothetical protein